MTPSSRTATPISFRDPTGHVFLYGDHVERSCSPQEVAHVRSLLGSAFFQSLLTDQLVCQSRFLEGPKTVWQELICPWSYPFEWSFSMLKDAALLTLELQLRAMADGYSLKDASAFNVAFINNKPIFADVYSFERFTPSLSWVAYDQFCREFLNPLILHSITGVSVSSLLQGKLTGITTSDTCRLVSWRALFRRGLLLHLYVKRKLDAQYSRPGTVAPLMSAEQQPNPEICLAVQRKLIKGLRNVLSRLASNYDSAWESYPKTNSYQMVEHQLKSDAVKEFAEQFPGMSVIDYGCNTGHYSVLVSSMFKSVVSIDSDEACVDRLYCSLKQSQVFRILPLVIDINNPSASLGWENGERHSFFERIDAEGFFALALIHHLRFGNNVPSSFIARFFARHDRGILEYVAFEDPMVQHLTRHRNRSDYADYEREPFEQALLKHFTINRCIRVSPTRELFVLSRT